MRSLKHLSIISLLSLLIGCSLINDDATIGWSADKLYEEAHDALQNGEYERAIELYTKLESRYPYGKYAQQAQLETIYSHYKAQEPASVIAAADRFIKLYPRHPSVDYAYYLRGLATFSEAGDMLSWLVKTDPAKRDPAGLRESFDYFSQLVTRFPNSRYTPDALQRMTYLRNKLAFHEIYAAEYYLKRGTYLAAAQRAKYVLEHYQQSTATPDALVVLVKAYRKLELTELADDALQVLQLNYANHPQLQQLQTVTTENEQPEQGE